MAAPLLQSLLRGDEKTDSILLQDTAECSGRLLVKSFAISLAERCSSVHIFLFDIHPQPWTSGLPPHVTQKLVVHDGYSDPLGWNGSPNSGLLSTACVQTYLQRTGPLGPNTAVIFDSISTLLLHHSTPQICRMLHQIGRQMGVLLCLVHSDLHEDGVILQLCHVMSTSIHVKSVGPELATEYKRSCSVVHRKKSGKVLRKTELFSITEDLTVAAMDTANLLLEAPTQEKGPDPTANLTFNLLLSEKERKERSKVVLPYTYTTERKSAHLQAGSGRIFYHPDDADDFDESDPDDDLDI